MATKLLYMNQGGAKTNTWGSISYKDYEVLCLAEDQGWTKARFKVNEKDGTPNMSVSTPDKEYTSAISAIKDIDITKHNVRPALTFQWRAPHIRVVFVHLKSGSELTADDEFKSITTTFQSLFFDPKVDTRILWIGDFNRATEDTVKSCLTANKFGEPTALLKTGGVSHWDLDRAYATGDWKGISVDASVASTSTDNLHAAIEIEIKN